MQDHFGTNTRRESATNYWRERTEYEANNHAEVLSNGKWISSISLKK